MKSSKLQSLAFRNAKEAMQFLTKTEGTESALLCFTEAVGELIQVELESGIKPHRGGIEKLLGSGVITEPPVSNHSQLFFKEGKPYSFMAHPYDLYLRDLENIISFCKAHKLTVHIDGRSSHLIGRTIRLIFRRVTEEISNV